MIRRVSYVTALMLLMMAAMSAPSRSQDAKSVDDSANAPAETVVVTGKRPTQDEARKIVWNFVYAHAKMTPKIDQLARWIQPICPEVRNIPAGYANFVKTRIKAIAAAVGAPVADDKSCHVNVEIIFTADPQAVMNGIVEKDPLLLGYHFVHQAQTLATVTKPIQAWYVTVTVGDGYGIIDDPYHSSAPGTPGSRISTGVASGFGHVLVLVDTEKVAGKPIGPVADYVAMLTLSQADAPGDCGALPSVLDLFSDDCPVNERPTSLTEADKTYLQGLYTMDSREIGSLQKSAIANSMLRAAP